MKEDQSSVSQSYIDSLQGIDRSPASFEDIQARAVELEKFMPQQRRMSIYDLATSLSQGLSSGDRATSLGYGLAAGFNLFSKEAQRRNAERDKIKRELLLLAKKEEDKRRADDVKIQEAGVEAQLKLALEKIKQGQDAEDIFKGKGDLASALNYIIRAQQDPSLKDSPIGAARYRAAVQVAQKPRQQVIQTEKGAKVVMIPGIDVSAIIGESPTSKPEPTAPDGYTFTGQYNKDGKPVFRNDVTKALAVEE